MNGERFELPSVFSVPSCENLLVKINRTSRLSAAGGSLETRQFQMIQPDNLAAGTGIDQSPSRSVMRMDFHPLLTLRAIDHLFHQFRINRLRSSLGATVHYPTIPDDIGKDRRFEKNPVAARAVVRATPVDSGLNQRVITSWTIHLAGGIQRGNSITVH